MLDVVDHSTGIWGAWLAADRAASIEALSHVEQPDAAAAGAGGHGAAATSADHAARAAGAAASAALGGWLLEGAPAEAGGLGVALLAESPALDAAWRRFPRREPAAAALGAAFGQEVMEAWWASVDGSARVADVGA
jgi:hypothetical protein